MNLRVCALPGVQVPGLPQGYKEKHCLKKPKANKQKTYWPMKNIKITHSTLLELVRETRNRGKDERV